MTTAYFNRANSASQLKEIFMKAFTTTLMCACLALAAGSVAAADDAMTKAPSTMNKDAMGNSSTMTMQQCKDRMAMQKKDSTMKKDDATMKMDATCADMMKNDPMMKKDNMSGDTMKK
jgi:hypothetical protein